jgi:hypothetical protein
MRSKKRLIDTTVKYAAIDAITERSIVFKPSLRMWYESYFLTRRTLLIILSVVISSYSVEKTVRFEVVACVVHLTTVASQHP